MIDKGSRRRLVVAVTGIGGATAVAAGLWLSAAGGTGGDAQAETRRVAARSADGTARPAQSGKAAVRPSPCPSLVTPGEGGAEPPAGSVPPKPRAEPAPPTARPVPPSATAGPVPPSPSGPVRPSRAVVPRPPAKAWPENCPGRPAEPAEPAPAPAPVPSRLPE